MTHLNVMILAAGRGSRLGGLGEDRPKWLLDVGGRTIADHQRAGLAPARDALASVTVVAGHAADAVDEYLAGDDGVAVLRNPEYARLNNWYSVLLGLRHLGDTVDRVVIINSDLFVPSGWVTGFLRDCATTPADALIAVDLDERRLTDESMKVAADGAGPGTLTAIGKVGVERPVGEYVGMLMAGGEVLTAFREALAGFEGRPEAADEWYERAVGLSADAGAAWRLWPTPGSDWVEIDDDDDHRAAIELSRSV